jgi:hypothetical protein
MVVPKERFLSRPLFKSSLVAFWFGLMSRSRAIDCCVVSKLGSILRLTVLFGALLVT